MFRKIILGLVTYPLLMPPGVCLCGRTRWEGGESWPCSVPRAVAGPAERPARAKTSGHPWIERGAPSEDECPPNCPGNEKTDHSKLVERGPAAPVWAAICLLNFSVGTSSGERIQAAVSLFQPSARPIYITLCTLVI